MILITLLTSYFSDEEIDRFSWTSFTSLFHVDLWLSLFLFSVGTSTFLWMLNRIQIGSMRINFQESIAFSSSSIIGLGKKIGIDVESKNSVRLTVFVIVICSTPFLYVYRSFLTSSLAVPAFYKPFNSPEDILSTNYMYSGLERYLTSGIFLNRLDIFTRHKDYPTT